MNAVKELCIMAAGTVLIIVSMGFAYFAVVSWIRRPPTELEFCLLVVILFYLGGKMGDVLIDLVFGEDLVITDE